MTPTAANLTTWAIAALATAGVIGRPFRLPEAVWAASGAALLVLLGLLPAADAWRGVGKGTDVYLFLIGMMLLSETARREGLFDWVAAAAVNAAKGSRRRLFALVYLVGIVVTAFLSNDATAVVLTPAVYAVSRTARADPLPYLFICAFIANAASFLLPISNPANLVVFADHMPSLVAWLGRFALPSVLAIAATFAGLRLVEGVTLRQPCAERVDQPKLSPGGWVALIAIGLTAWPSRPWISRSERPPASWASSPQRSSICGPGPRPGLCCAASPGRCCPWWPACSCSSRPSAAAA